MNKIKKFLHATFSFLTNYYSDFENAYDEGFQHGYDEGFSEGYSCGKTDGQRLFREVYRYLAKNGLIEDGEEISGNQAFELMNAYIEGLKIAIETQKNVGN